MYTAVLFAASVAVLSYSWQHPSAANHIDWATAIILGVTIILVEKFEIDFPHPYFQFSISIGAILALACGLTLGPLYGALVVVAAELASDVWAKLKPIQVVVNSSNIGLATFLGASTYFYLAGDASTPIDNVRSMASTILAASVYSLINTGVLAIIIAPVVGDTPLRMWKANFSLTYVLVSLPTLACLVPVIARINPIGVLVLFAPLLASHAAQRTLHKVEIQTQATMEGLADALERRDPYTSRHSIRVTDYVRAILDELPPMPVMSAQTIIDAARIHDLGKVGTQDSALRKPGPLTDEERQDIQQHSAIGADIVGRLETYKRIAIVVRHHHERWDGKGYPNGLSAEDIPFGSRIICVADSFDAMTSDRPYRPALSLETALGELRKHSGTQFDPTIVEAFERAILKPMPGIEPALMAASAD